MLNVVISGGSFSVVLLFALFVLLQVVFGKKNHNSLFQLTVLFCEGEERAGS